MTNETLLLRKTRKEIEKRHTANKYAHACAGVVDTAKGRYLDTAGIFDLAGAMPVAYAQLDQ